ncbi:porin family protein [Wenyingzhuangia sp. chi5]|uniref:Porin family protein n=1 Tax=Wenyingzhuangia gilva TaxID=3057677 RepID=A0ABT8VNZ2_9FLAO|nr:porin family protein [Wenyingzhuangia sp. chi5]MDO3693669.1 porin family protein [Wenyingzhuangia sp. chi5]
MKQFVVYLFFCLCSISYGQTEKISRLQSFDNRPIRYGFYLGLHTKGYAIESSPDVILSSGAGFHLGVLADLKASDFVSFLTEPGIISSTNSLTFDGEKTEVPATYFHLPVSIKLSTRRLNNVRGFVIGGVSYNYNFTANKNNNDNGANPRDFELKQHTLMGEIGIGASFYFPYFKFSPSIRGIYGFQNEFIGLGTIAKANISELRTRGVFLTLTFQ